MAKDKIAYVCSNCGQESSKWIGKCPSCGQWNTFKEIRIANDTGSQAARNAGMSMRHGGAATMFGGNHSDGGARPVRLRDISAHDEPRIDMHDGELNRVLGEDWFLAVSRSWAVSRASERVHSHFRPFFICPT